MEWRKRAAMVSTFSPRLVFYPHPALTLLLLVLRKQRHKESQILSNSPLLKISLKLRLKTIVQCGELGSNVESTSLPVCFGCEFSGELGVLVEGDVLDAEYARVGLGVDGEGALVSLGEDGGEGDRKSQKTSPY
jgi:hypothetical protein